MSFHDRIVAFRQEIPYVFDNMLTYYEQLLRLGKCIEHVWEFLDTVPFDTIADNTARIEELENRNAKLEAQVASLESAFETLTTSMLVYDPTKGMYTASIDQARRMVQALGNAPVEVNTVQKVAEITVANFAKRMCGEYINEDFRKYLGITIPRQEVGK